MKLSIIVPVYNVENVLGECIESLVRQTIDDYEIILIDDGSKDNSWAVIEDYMARYPSLIVARSIPNGGQGRARNLGLELSRGEYIGFVDSDDWVDTRMYEKLYKKALETDADIVCCDIEEHYSNGTVRRVVLSNVEDRMSTGGSACNRLFKRSYIGDARFPGGVWYEDFAFITKLILKNGVISSLPEALYFYRIGENTTMKNNNARKNLDIITVIEDIRKYSGEPGEIEELILNHVLLEAIKRVEMQDSPDKKEVISALREYVKANIPELSKCPAYVRQPRNTRIIMKLNYDGHSDMAVGILKLKSMIRK